MTRGDRARDLLALGLLVIAVIPTAYAWLGMHELASQEHIVVRPGEVAFSQFMHYFWFAVAGLLLLVSGIVVAVWTYFRRRRRIRGGTA
jgi:hypothetical protein